MANEMNDWNANIIKEFRDNGGTAEQFGDALVLLHNTGAKSGQERINPVAYQPTDNGGWYVFASKAGADTNPDWYHNLKANPDATIEVGVDGTIQTIDVTARELPRDERDPVWEKQKQLMPGFADYEKKTDRVIPVVELTRR